MSSPRGLLPGLHRELPCSQRCSACMSLLGPSHDGFRPVCFCGMLQLAKSLQAPSRFAGVRLDPSKQDSLFYHHAGGRTLGAQKWGGDEEAQACCSFREQEAQEGDQEEALEDEAVEPGRRGERLGGGPLGTQHPVSLLHPRLRDLDDCDSPRSQLDRPPLPLPSAPLTV